MCVGVHALIFCSTYCREELSLLALSSDKQAKKSTNIIRVSHLFETREILVYSLITELQRTGRAARTIHCNYRIFKYVFNTYSVYLKNTSQKKAFEGKIQSKEKISNFTIK